MESPEEQVTGLLKAWGNGDETALNRLITLVHGELRLMARRHLRNQRPGHSLQTTALVNQAYLRLIDIKNVDWRHRAQFLAISAHIMRLILVDAARARSARKRGGGAERVDLDEAALASPAHDESIVALNDALSELEKLAPRQAQVVEMRYFGGLNEHEIAAVLDTSTRTI